MILYAKSNPVKSISEHTDDLLLVMNKLRESLADNPVIDWELLKVIIVAHDLGKINRKFQDRIYKAINQTDETGPDTSAGDHEVDHNILSTAFLAEILHGLGLEEKSKHILYKSVAFHHKHYLYYVENIHKFSYDKIQKSIFYDIEKVYERGDERIVALNEYVRKTLGLRNSIDLLNLDYNFFPYFNEWFEDDDGRDKRSYLLLKGMLHLCDHIASAGYHTGTDFYFSHEEIEGIDGKLLSFLRKKTSQEDVIFKDFQDKTKENISKNILTVAFTGSGKTIADHRWAGRRKFYLVPTRISGEAFYFDSLTIYDEEKVGLLHGDVNLYIDSTDTDSISITEGSYQLARNLSKPYIISTIDQIVTAIFKYPGYEKTFSALTGSKITVDEIHLLTPRMYSLLLFLVSFLNENGFDTQFHFMSATIPQIYREKLNESGVNYTSNDVDIDSRNLADIVCGISFFEKKNNTAEKIRTIMGWIDKHPKALIIVNSIKHAMELYESLIEVYKPERIHLLHSRFKFEDKRNKYHDILNNPPDGIWITTQVVEVALDIDFPVVISELSPFESMIQRMGRCNRKGKLPHGFFYVFSDSNYEETNKAIYEHEFLDQTRSFIKKHLKQKAPVSQLRRKELLEEYFNSEKIKNEYERQFESAEEAILKLFGIKNQRAEKNVITGTDLLFNIDPHINVTESKKQAQKLFREGEMQIKIILKSDFEELGSDNVVSRSLTLSKKSIPISGGIYWRLKKKYPNLLTQRKNLFILDDSDTHISYSSQKGLEVS